MLDIECKYFWLEAIFFTMEPLCATAREQDNYEYPIY